MPRLTASAAMSAWLRRENGNPRSLGSSQANALTSTTISGGKDAGPPAPWPLVKARESFVEEAFSPPADNLAGNRQSIADLFVLQPFCRKEDDLGANDLKIW